jgi:hypothetical protein
LSGTAVKCFSIVRLPMERRKNSIEETEEQIEAVLEKQPENRMPYNALKDVFKDLDPITYFLAIGNLKRGKRLKMFTEDGIVQYELI